MEVVPTVNEIIKDNFCDLVLSTADSYIKSDRWSDAIQLINFSSSIQGHLSSPIIFQLFKKISKDATSTLPIGKALKVLMDLKEVIEKNAFASFSDRCSIYNNISCLYLRLKDLKRARKYIERALAITISHKLSQIDLACTYLNSCAIFSAMTRHLQAAEYAKKALEVAQGLNLLEETNKKLFGTACYNYASEKAFLKDFQVAYDYYQQCIHLLTGLKDSESMIQESLKNLEELKTLKKNKPKTRPNSANIRAKLISYRVADREALKNNNFLRTPKSPNREFFSLQVKVNEKLREEKKTGFQMLVEKKKEMEKRLLRPPTAPKVYRKTVKKIPHSGIKEFRIVSECSIKVGPSRPSSARVFQHSPNNLSIVNLDKESFTKSTLIDQSEIDITIKKDKEIFNEPLEKESNVKEAIIKIQAFVRGNLTRKKINLLRRKKNLFQTRRNLFGKDYFITVFEIYGKFYLKLIDLINHENNFEIELLNQPTDIDLLLNTIKFNSNGVPSIHNSKINDNLHELDEIQRKNLIFETSPNFGNEEKKQYSESTKFTNDEIQIKNLINGGKIISNQEKSEINICDKFDEQIVTGEKELSSISEKSDLEKNDLKSSSDKENLLEKIIIEKNQIDKENSIQDDLNKIIVNNSNKKNELMIDEKENSTDMNNGSIEIQRLPENEMKKSIDPDINAQNLIILDESELKIIRDSVDLSKNSEREIKEEIHEFYSENNLESNKSSIKSRDNSEEGAFEIKNCENSQMTSKEISFPKIASVTIDNVIEEVEGNFIDKTDSEYGTNKNEIQSKGNNNHLQIQANDFRIQVAIIEKFFYTNRFKLQNFKEVIKIHKFYKVYYNITALANDHFFELKIESCNSQRKRLRIPYSSLKKLYNNTIFTLRSLGLYLISITKYFSQSPSVVKTPNKSVDYFSKLITGLFRRNLLKNLKKRSKETKIFENHQSNRISEEIFHLKTEIFESFLHIEAYKNDLSLHICLKSSILKEYSSELELKTILEQTVYPSLYIKLNNNEKFLCGPSHFQIRLPRKVQPNTNLIKETIKTFQNNKYLIKIIKENKCFVVFCRNSQEELIMHIPENSLNNYLNGEEFTDFVLQKIEINESGKLRIFEFNENRVILMIDSVINSENHSVLVIREGTNILIQTYNFDVDRSLSLFLNNHSIQISHIENLIQTLEYVYINKEPSLIITN